MAIFYFVIKHGNEAGPASTLDLPDLRAAWEEASTAAGEILKELDGSLEVGVEWSIQVQNEAQKPLRTLRITTESN